MTRDPDASEIVSESEGDLQGYDRADRQEIIDVIARADTGWQVPKDPIDFSAVQWTPDLVKPDERAVCHVHIVRKLATSWSRRMKAAKQGGYRVVCAGPLNCWYSDETLVELDELGIEPMVLEQKGGGKWVLKKYRSISELVAMQKLRLETAALTRIGGAVLSRALRATAAHERGWMFEDFLCLLFSQVEYFEVYAHNFENETEEVDVVLYNRRIGGWAAPAAPIVIVSGKNTTDRVGVSALNSLHAKMQNRRGQCKLGFLCASNGITETVEIQDLRHSHEDRVVVMLDGDSLKQLIDKPNELAKRIEDLVTKAILR